MLGHNRIIAQLVIISILVLTLAVHGAALAQFIPLPPPSASTGQQNNNSHVAINDKSQPEIEILTKTIYEGKNVFKVKIVDQSGIGSSNIKYVNNGQIVTKSLSPAQGQSGIYHTLIDMSTPSRIVQIQVTDMAGNMIDTYETYDVVSSNSFFFDRLTDALTWLWNSLTMGK